jgi:hypothetical protein
MGDSRQDANGDTGGLTMSSDSDSGSGGQNELSASSSYGQSSDLGSGLGMAMDAMAMGTAIGSSPTQDMSYNQYRSMARMRSLRSAIRYALTGTTGGSFTPGGGGAYKFGDATQNQSQASMQTQMMSMMQNQQNMQMQMLQLMTQGQQNQTSIGGADSGAEA